MALHPRHEQALIAESAIDPEIIRERGYFSVMRDNVGETARRLKALNLPTWAFKERKQHDGFVIPLYGASGERVTVQYRPDFPAKNRDGKALKYVSPKGQASRIDIHPRNKDRVIDPSVPLWITEGVKKADSLTTRDACTIALTGVYNWRGRMCTLGDWEDIPLRGRVIYICFDADAKENKNVLRAMVRLGKWLSGPKGAKKVVYVIVPEEVNDVPVKGADDFFAAGGTIEQLIEAGSTTPPNTDITDGTFSDAFMADSVSSDVLEDTFRWSPGTGWIEWDGRVWEMVDESAVVEAVRRYVMDKFQGAVEQARGGSGNQAVIDGWRSFLSKGRISSVVQLARGILTFKTEDMDADPDLLNCPNGIVDLRTGELLPHDPDLLMTKITNVEYDRNADLSLVERALTAVPDEIGPWLQLRLGQSVTGHMTPDDVVCILTGSGHNGKSTILAGVISALGSYYKLIADEVLLGTAQRDETMELRGTRSAWVEETPEAAHLNVVRLKKLAGTEEVKGHYLYKPTETWTATHSLFVTTNYKPLINETDHGTWRRLALVRFPYTYVKNPTEPHERLIDPTVRERFRTDPAAAKATLRWLVEGARCWYEANMVMPDHPDVVIQDTLLWRKETDLVLAYWDERLEADPNSHVASDDLLRDFNAWISTQGHREWSSKTFAGRFADHQATQSARVQKGRVRRATPGLSRPTPSFAPLAEMVTAWKGVRFAPLAHVAQHAGLRTA